MSQHVVMYAMTWKAGKEKPRNYHIKHTFVWFIFQLIGQCHAYTLNVGKAVFRYYFMRCEIKESQIEVQFFHISSHL